MARASVNGSDRLLVGGSRVSDARQDTKLHERCQQAIVNVLFRGVINNMYPAASESSQRGDLNRIGAANAGFVLRPFFRVADEWPLEANTGNFRPLLEFPALRHSDNTLYLHGGFRLTSCGDSREKRGNAGTREFTGHSRDI